MFRENEALFMLREAIETLLEEGYTPREIIAEIKYIFRDIQEELKD